MRVILRILMLVCLPVAAFASVEGAQSPYTMSRMLGDGDVRNAMVACMKAHPAGLAGAWAEDALPMNHGKALLTLNDREGRRRECIVDLGTAQVESLTILGVDVGQVYVPRTTARTAAPTGACFKAVPVVADKLLYGWRLERDMSAGCNSKDWLPPLR